MTVLTHQIEFESANFYTDTTGLTLTNDSITEAATALTFNAAAPLIAPFFNATWVVDPIEGDLLRTEYDGLGNLRSLDGVPTASFSGSMVNCLSNAIMTIKGESYAGTRWTHDPDSLSEDETFNRPAWVLQEVGTGTVTVEGVNGETVFCDAQPGDQSIAIMSIPTVAGRLYAMTFDVSDLIVDGGANFAFIANIVGLQGGAIGITRLDVPSGTTGRIGLIFGSITDSPSVAIRMGCGTNAGVGSARSVRITRPQIQDITQFAGDVFHDYSGRPALVNTLPANTLSNGRDGIVTATVGAPYVHGSLPYALVLTTGDSFASGAVNWATHLDDIMISGAVLNKGRGSQTLTGQIGQNFASDLTKGAFTSAVIQGGINDINLDDATLAEMQAAVIGMVADARAAGLGNNIIIVGISPYKNTSFGNYTPARQAVLDSYNAWVPTYVAAEGLKGFADIYPLMGDTDPQVLDPALDSGDGLHPSSAGYLVIAQAVQALQT